MDARNDKGREKIVNAFQYKEWSCPVTGRIDWSTANLSYLVSTNVTKQLETARMKNKNSGTLRGISKVDRTDLLPKQFHVYQKAIPSGVKK